MTYLEQAEKLVREHPSNASLMELGFGCEVRLDNGDRITTYLADDDDGFWVRDRKYGDPIRLGKWSTGFFNLGKPANLQNYLRVLEAKKTLNVDGGKMHAWNFTVDTTGQALNENGMHLMKFNLTEGRPASEEDAKKFLELVEDK